MPDLFVDVKALSDVLGYTANSVLFIDSDSLIAQDNAGFTYDASTDTLLLAGNVEFKSGTSFKGILDHANTVNRTYTLPDYDGTVATLAGTETFTGKSMSGASNTFSAIPYSALVLTGAILNADLAGSIAYSKLVLTNSIVDGDIVSITTRGKLPSAIAYEDEANTFSATLTMSGANINIGGNKLLTSNLEILQAVAKRYDAGVSAGVIAAAPSASGIGAFAIYPHTLTTAQLQIFSTPGELGDTDDYEVLTLFKDATMAAIDVTKGGTGTLRPLHIRMGGNEIITISIANAVDANSRTFSNFVASSPTFTDSPLFSDDVLSSVGGFGFDILNANSNDGRMRVRYGSDSLGYMISSNASIGDWSSGRLATTNLDYTGRGGWLVYAANAASDATSFYEISFVPVGVNPRTPAAVLTIPGSGAIVSTRSISIGTNNLVVTTGSIGSTGGDTAWSLVQNNLAMITFGAGSVMDFNSRVVSNLVGSSPTFSGTVALGTSTVSGTPIFSGSVEFNGGVVIDTAGLTITDVNVVLGTVTGSQIGTAAGQKVAFHGATPVIQAANIADPAGGATQDAEARAAINAILVVLENKGLTAAA